MRAGGCAHILDYLPNMARILHCLTAKERTSSSLPESIFRGRDTSAWIEFLQEMIALSEARRATRA